MKWAALVILAIAAVIHAETVVDEGWVVTTFSKLFSVFSLLDVPTSLHARYELFHTAYITDREITIVDRPLIPGETVKEMLEIATKIRQLASDGV